MTNPRLIDSKLITLPCSDLKTVNSARVSMKVAHEEFTEPGDSKLIKYLASHAHWTPFSHNRDTIFFKVESRTIYNAFVNMLTVGLSIEEKASMVIQDNININHDNYIAIKTSMYGWVNIAKKLMKTYMGEDGYTVELIMSVLYSKYPVSTKAYFTDEEITKYHNDYNYQVNLGILNAALPLLSRKMFDITLYETVPIFVARQRFKAMVSNTYNEVSKRYVDEIPALYALTEWSMRPEKSIKQGAGLPHPDAVAITKEYEEFCTTVLAYYDKLVNEYRVAPEQARIVVPQSMMTEYYVTANLEAVDRFIEQRTYSGAQKEIRDLANITKSIVENIDSHMASIAMSGRQPSVNDYEHLGVF